MSSLSWLYTLAVLGQLVAFHQTVLQRARVLSFCGSTIFSMYFSGSPHLPETRQWKEHGVSLVETWYGPNLQTVYTAFVPSPQVSGKHSLDLCLIGRGKRFDQQLPSTGVLTLQGASKLPEGLFKPRLLEPRPRCLMQ